MTLVGIPIKQFWAFLTWLPKFFLRKKFPPETLAGLVYVDVRPRNDPVTINLGLSAEFRIWLQLINLSPFELELDRAEFRLMCGPALTASILKRQKIAPGAITTLMVQGSITDGQANQMVNTIANYPVSIDGHIEFNCALHPFAKPVGLLDGIKPIVLNADVRLNPA
jgi:hypothetical protein